VIISDGEIMSESERVCNTGSSGEDSDDVLSIYCSPYKGIVESGESLTVTEYLDVRPRDSTPYIQTVINEAPVELENV
jgi:hypothetical protein